MKQIIYLFLAISVITYSCDSLSEKPALKSGLYPEYMDSTYSPGNDFHMYVSGNWIKNTEMPADKSSYGIGYILHEKSQDDVKKIIEESAAGNFPKGTDEQKVGDLYKSYMNIDKRNELGISPLQTEFDQIDAIANLDDLIGFWGNAGKYGIETPLGLFVMADWKNPELNSLYSWQSGLGLPDREYYLSDDQTMIANRVAYKVHLTKMFELAQLENPDQSAQDIIDLETQIANIHWKKEDNRDRLKNYNLFPIDSLDNLMPNYNWKVYLAQTGISDVKSIIVTQPSYVLGLDKLMSSVGLKTWKTYTKWLILNNAATRLNQAIDDQNFLFYRGTLSGVKKQTEQWRRAVNLVNGNLGEIVGKVYVSKHFPPEAKARMNELVNNLTKAYEVSIKELDWMGEETKKQALVKLSKFTTKIGYPDKWTDYSAVEIGAEDLYGNIRSALLAEHNKDIAKIGKPVDKTEWHMTPQTVNAYYNPAANEIVFPAAIMQPPFFDMTADDAVNYGSIGAIIGHEIGHGFDDKGSAFDGDGALNNWWTEEDQSEFKKRGQKLVDQFNTYKVLDDLYVNGEYTLGENIGDLGGVTISLKAYQMSLNGDKAPIIDGITGIQRFFLGYAQSWRSIVRDEAIRMQVNTDSHSPNPFRVNGVVRNVPEFYDAFNIQPGDSLYLAPADRVKIW